MNEISKYVVLKEKLQGICDENNLTFSIQNKKYPFFMTVKPISGLDGQMTMLEEADTGDTGYISPEAIIVFAYKDGDLTYKMADTISITSGIAPRTTKTRATPPRSLQRPTMLPIPPTEPMRTSSRISLAMITV